MSEPPTIYEVADQAGVSISTVSLVLNKPDRVSEKTRQKVLSVIERLNFIPKTDAVTRARKGVGRLGVLGPFSSYASCRERIVGIAQAARDHSIEVVLFDEPSATQSTIPLLESLPRTGRLDGILVVSLPIGNSDGERLKELGLPTVLIDTRLRGFDAVYIDDVAGGAMAAEHLIARGHTSFGFMGESHAAASLRTQTTRRLDGFMNGLTHHGHALSPGRVLHCPRDIDAATIAAIPLLQGMPRPGAIFACDDLLAAGVWRAARRLGLSIPTDLAIIGYDDGDVAKALDLTTIRQPLRESGIAGFELLLKRLERPVGPREVKLDLELVVRSSA